MKRCARCKAYDAEQRCREHGDVAFCDACVSQCTACYATDCLECVPGGAPRMCEDHVIYCDAHEVCDECYSIGCRRCNEPCCALKTDPLCDYCLQYNETDSDCEE